MPDAAFTPHWSPPPGVDSLHVFVELRCRDGNGPGRTSTTVFPGMYFAIAHTGNGFLSDVIDVALAAAKHTGNGRVVAMELRHEDRWNGAPELALRVGTIRHA